jgi:hypothetical protein
MEPFQGSDSLLTREIPEWERAAMSMRTVEKPYGADEWHRGQSSELLKGTIYLTLSFALFCLFLVVMR